VARPVLNGEKDIVIGVRDETSDKVLVRIPGKKLLKFIAQLVVQSPIPDLNSGLRCFKKSIIKQYLHLLPDGFSASTTSTLLMMKRRYRLGYESIITKERIGTSSVKILRDGWSILQLIFRILILFEAFNFFTTLALIQIVTASIYGFYTAIVNKMGFPILAATIFISGILTFFMGLICDQIVSLRKERFEK
jgi:hypothetical protein